ncbi:MAG: hypothetical protein ACYTG4_07900, partial [Planctomycetota bacterium]
SVKSRAADLLKAPVPDGPYLDKLDQVVEVSDGRVADLAGKVGRTNQGEALWDDCITDILEQIGENSEGTRRELMDLARSLPSAAFTRVHGRAVDVLQARASQADVELVQEDLGFERVREEEFSRNLATLAAVVRVVDRAITEGVSRVEGIAINSGTLRIGGSEVDPFVQAHSVMFRLRGQPRVLANVIRSCNERPDASGPRLVLDEVRSLGRAEGVRSDRDGLAEFGIRVMRINLEAKDEEELE